MNLWDILILLAVAAVVLLAIRTLRMGRRGCCERSGCSGCCQDCSCACSQKNKTDKKT